MGAPADPFGAFVAGEHRGLLQLARLLEDDPGDAEALVRAAVTRVRRSWRRSSGDPASAARAAIVRRVLAGGPADGTRTSGFVDDFDAAWYGDESADLRRALSELPVRTRTATVLSRWAGLPDEEVADLLRDEPDAVRAEVAAGSARLGSALTPVRSSWCPGPPSGGPPPEEDLGLRLAALAEDVVPAGPAGALADEARARARVLRRRWVAGTVAAVTALVVAVPVLTAPGPAAEQAAPVTSRPTRAVPEPLPRDVSELPPRGSLAGDEAFLAALRELPWEPGLDLGFPPGSLPPAEDRRVLFAGDVPGGRWALVAAPPPWTASDRPDSPVVGGGTMMQWFTGPVGARPEEMVVSSYPYGVPPGTPPSLVDPRTGTLVVLAAPGDVVELSARPVVAADGSRSRSWEEVTGDDGVAVARVPVTGLPWSWSTTFRVLREEQRGSAAITGVPDVVRTEADEPEFPSLDVRHVRGPPSPAHREVAEHAAGTVLTQLGLSPADVEITALVATAMPEPAVGTLALVAVRVPSGAVVLTGSWSRTLPDGESTGQGSVAATGECGLSLRPAGTPVTQRVVAAACEVWDPRSGESEGAVLVVSAPPSVAAVRVYDGEGDYAGEHPLRDGTLVVPAPLGVTTVEAVTGDGVLMGRTEVLSTGIWLGD